MKLNTLLNKNFLPPELTVFAALAPLLNLFAFIHIGQPVLFYIVQFFAFVYVIVTPGLFILSLITKKRFPFALGLAFSVALSVFSLMVVGLIINTFLPLIGIIAPLTTLPLLLGFDLLIVVLFVLNAVYEKEFALEIPRYNKKSLFVLFLAFLMPILAVVGSIVLNNDGTSLWTMLSLSLVLVLVPLVVFDRESIDPSIPPVALYMMALALLLMNSMRGWYITGHDILLEYHVFSLTADAHVWKMSLYQDPYMACLSLTILPTYLQSILQLATTYVFKFFTQFLGALSVVVVYYLNRLYVSEKIAFLAGFLYITFPTFMVDMAFLNRQGVAFLFFGAMIYTLFTTEYYGKITKSIMLFVFGVGMIFSHYSTSYIAIPVFIGAYILNKIIRFLVAKEKPVWLAALTDRLANKKMYTKPILLTLPFVIGLMIVMVLWSSVITKTSRSFMNTIQQVVVSLKHPFSLDEQTGPAKYSLVRAQQPTPEELLSRFVKQGIYNQKVLLHPSEFFPLSLTKSYPAIPVLEAPAPLTSIGQKIQSISHLNLGNLFNDIKQTYAKILQVLLIIGLIGLSIGYKFKKNLLQDIPVEYLALSASGIIVMVGQTILPAGAIDYGLLRLFQQNLLFLSLPIFLGLLLLSSLVFRKHKNQLILCTIILLLFFTVLSGIVPQITGGGRPLLSLNNKGLYYDSYYTHAEEVASAQWIARYKGSRLPIQAAHFSDIKMIAYGHIGAYIELLPETTKKNSFVYLNYDNVKTSNILEIIYGDVVYYHFPMKFLEDHKNLIYSNGGSKIYR